MAATWRNSAALLALLLSAAGALAAPPAWLPRYDVEMDVDVNAHIVRAHQRVTWTNRHQRPADKLVFNVYSHYKLPDDEVGLIAKTVELLRMYPSETIDFEGHAGHVEKITLDGAAVPFFYQADMPTALEVHLPRQVGPGESVTVEIDFCLRLPPKQGRWGQWEGVTFLTHWLPMLAYHDEEGWQPTPFIPWHQPFFTEAGIYTVGATVPCEQHVACTGTVQRVQDLGDGRKRLEIRACGVRDFAFLCSARYQEYTAHAGPVLVRVVAFPEHEHYARAILRIACEAVEAYSAWIGPYPYPELTIAESFFGWNGNECATLVMIDARIFAMPHLAEGFVEYLVSHEVCHQWWYNLIGTNGYCETWMDEGPATYFSHRLMNMKRGKNNGLLKLPRGLGWLPNIHREDYRHYGLCGTLGRGEACATVQELPKFGHVVNLFSMTYDKGYKIVGMIEDRLGETAFLDFMHIIYANYQYRILRVADFQRELEAYTGTSWEEFFRCWLHGPGLCDWCVEKVKLEPVVKSRGRRLLPESFLAALGNDEVCQQPYRVSVVLRQKGECNEATVIGFCLDGGEGYQIRLPVHPGVPVLEIEDPPARIEAQPDGQVRVDVVLPCRPTQITVDPDQVLVDKDPTNNHWNSKIRWRLTPLYTALEETDVTNAYDRWNIVAGPWLYGPAYNDPWFTRSTMAGLRIGAYRTQQFNGGGYLAYRTDYEDIAAGIDLFKDHWPWPHTQVGFNAERSISQFSENQATADRGVLYGRYIIQYASSLYLPPMHYVEMFSAVQNHYLPYSANVVEGSRRVDHETAVGLHYRIDYLTPYWDAEGGYRVDATYAYGVPIFGQKEEFNQLLGRISFVKCLPDCLGPWLSQTRLAMQAYGAVGLPDQGQYFTLGGSTLLRGFDLAERQGSIIWVTSAEWRIPFARNLHWDCCDHTVGLRGIYGAAFYDVGNAYLNGQSLGSVAHSLGGGLRLDVAWFSFIERTILRFDVAKVVNASTPTQFWFGVQHPF